jgi:hypothetical protein
VTPAFKHIARATKPTRGRQFTATDVSGGGGRARHIRYIVKGYFERIFVFLTDALSGTLHLRIPGGKLVSNEDDRRHGVIEISSSAI